MGSITETNSSTSLASSGCTPGVSNSVEICSFRQCDGAVCDSVQAGRADDTCVMSDTPLQDEHNEQPASSQEAATTWMLQSTCAWTAPYPQHGSAARTAAAVNDTVPANYWTIRTGDDPACVNRRIYSSAGSRSSTDAEAAIDDGCSDPLVCAAQELVAAAVASSTPGVHSTVADSAALLNSGAMLLLGHASTTMQGSNTAEAPPSSADNMLAPDDCRSHVLADFPSEPAMPAAVNAVGTRQQQRMLAPELEAIDHEAVPQRHPGSPNSSRWPGLLVDSSPGMQQLRAGVVMVGSCPPQHNSIGQEQPSVPLPDAPLHAQALGLQQDVTQLHEPTAAGTMLPCSQALPTAFPVTDQAEPARQTSLEEGRCTVGQMLSVEDAPELHAVDSDSTFQALRAAPTTVLVACPEESSEDFTPEASGSQVEDAADACETSLLPSTSSPLQPAAWQPLSGSSLASLPVLGRSNSSLNQGGLSNCRFMHFDSISTTAGSVASSFSQRPPSHQGSMRSTGGGAYSITGSHAWSAGDGSFTSQRHNLACLRLNSFSSFTSAPGGQGLSFTAGQEARFAPRSHVVASSPHRGQHPQGFIRFGSFSAAMTNAGMFEGGMDGSFTSQRHSGATTATNLTGCIRLGSFTSGAGGGHGVYGNRLDALRSTAGRQPSFTGLPPVLDYAASEPLVTGGLSSAAPPSLDGPTLLPLHENTSGWQQQSRTADLPDSSAQPKAIQGLCQPAAGCAEQQEKPAAPHQQLMYLFD